MLMASVLAGLAFSVIWFKIVRRYTKGIIYTTALSVVVAQVTVAIGEMWGWPFLLLLQWFLPGGF